MASHDALRGRLDELAAADAIGCDEPGFEVERHVDHGILPVHLVDLRIRIQHDVAARIAGTRRAEGGDEARDEHEVGELVDTAIEASGEPLSRSERENLRR